MEVIFIGEGDTERLTFQITMRRAVIGAALLLLCALYLLNLSSMGLVTPDEPRYADIGRAMARSGDWITPRLSGVPWFEKPPLLYWLVAAGFKAGLNTELAPRLPVALLSVGFLILFWRKLSALWDERTASYATAILATSGGWLAFSHVSVTDIPLAVMFSMAVLFALERRIVAAAAALGFAVLAKSLVPLVLFAPLLALDYRHWRQWLRPAPVVAFLCITVPWHVLCTIRNGSVFLKTLFIEHQFGRFTSGAMQHEQRWWFYLPVLLLLVFPWFPFALFAARGIRDRRARWLATIIAAGFIFFSISVNKLPGYLLPLLPSLCALAGIGMARARSLKLTSCCAVVLLAFLPGVAALLPPAIEGGLRGLDLIPLFVSPWSLCALAAAGLIAILPSRHSFPLAVACASFALLAFEFTVMPQIDANASARPLWLRDHPSCISPGARRATLYGLNYYSGRMLPECAVLDQTPSRVVR